MLHSDSVSTEMGQHCRYQSDTNVCLLSEPWRREGNCVALTGFVFKTWGQSHGTQAGLKLTVKPRMTLILATYLHDLSAGIL